MHANSVNAMKMLSFLAQPDNGPESPAPRRKVVSKKKAVEDYPYETESSDSEVEVIEKPKKKKVVAKKEVKAQTELPQPAPPAPITMEAPKEKKVRAKKEKVTAPEVVASGAATPAPEGGKGAPLGGSESYGKKQKRAPSLYNKFASEKMKAGMSMKDVAAAWKAEKEKSAK